MLERPGIGWPLQFGLLQFPCQVVVQTQFSIS